MARSSSDFFESSSIQSSDERIEVSQFSMATLERETIEGANLGGANMHVVRGCHFWQLGSIASLAGETTGWEILVAVWPKHGLRSNLRVPNFKFFLGEPAPRPSSLFTLKSVCSSLISMAVPV